ncbi:MAG: hypothetical protein B7Y88_02870 [Sphingomonadales bacterium 32-64-17]|nr:MAG: hypothetical protein B7Y88_02870 [Sphingomonadales bacterium 32-64-17]
MAGFPIWYELMTPDPVAVAPFYKATLGWHIPTSGDQLPHGAEYRMISHADGSFQGGVLTLTPDMAAGGARPGWLPYFDVADVEGWCEAAKARGASVWMVQETPGVGTMAMVSDPEGAPFYVMKPQPPEGQPDAQSTVFQPGTVGHCAWNERNHVTGEAMLEFYTSLFDWAEDSSVPMPEGHFYRIFSLDNQRIGAIGSMGIADMPPLWLPYFRVADLAAAHRAVGGTGGSVIMEPHPVPGGDSIFVAQDPGGAFVAFVTKDA